MFFSKFPLLSFALMLLSSCTELGQIPPRSTPQTAVEIAFAKTVLDDLQPQSIAQNREFCGFIGIDHTGNYIATSPTRGQKGTCQPRNNEGFTPLASYHTHGAYSVEYDSELPSSDDLLADISEGVDGYIGTPGGRVWFNNAATERSTLLCDVNCIHADPSFDPAGAPPPTTEYDIDTIYARENNPG